MYDIPMLCRNLVKFLHSNAVEHAVCSGDNGTKAAFASLLGGPGF